MSDNSKPEDPGGTVVPAGFPGLPEEITPIEMVASTLVLFAPHLDEASAFAISEQVLKEQVLLAQGLIMDITDEQKNVSHPYWGMEVFGHDGGRGRMSAYKPGSPGKPNPRINSVRDALDLAEMVGFAMVPLCRAVLRAYGINYQFQSFKRNEADDIIIKPS